MFGKKEVEVIPRKVILLGGSNVGKTTMIIRWNTGNFENNTYNTIGAAYTSKTISFTEEEKIQLNIWDTSGSEKFDSMTKLYYRDAEAAILCYEVVDEESLDRAAYWAREVRRQAPQCRIYLVGTKVDLLAQEGILEEATLEEATRLKSEIGAKGLFRTSSKTGEGVNEVFETIALHLITRRTPAGIRPGEISVEAMATDKDCGIFSCSN